MYDDIYHVLIGLVMGISFMVCYMGLDKKDGTVFWSGAIVFLIGCYLFITI